MRLFDDLKQQWVGVVSILIATTALMSAQWRSEITEENRTLRYASFEVLRELGALQQLVDQGHYGEQKPQDIHIHGWNHVLLIQDFSLLLSQPVQQQASELTEQWQQHWPTLIESPQSNQVLSKQIKHTRMAVTDLVKSLD